MPGTSGHTGAVSPSGARRERDRRLGVTVSTNSVLLYVLGDIAIVVAASALLGNLARRLGQPAVVGQVITGILLGTSFLGRLPGHLEQHLFPAAVVPYLTVLSQVA